MNDPITDWLDVTFSPDDSPGQALHDFLMGENAWPIEAGKYRIGDRGTVFLQTRKRFTRVSFSGAALTVFRTTGAFLDLLSLLGAQPHRVTRLDAAYDTNEKGPEVVAHLRASYPLSVQLSRKLVKTSVMLSANLEGLETGTWYAGHRSAAKVTARVYDKAHQMYEKYGELHPPWTRYEITVRAANGPTLKDAYDPTGIFWHYASPSLLPRPPDAPKWSQGDDTGWFHAYEPPLPAEVLKRRVDASPELAVLAELADKAGPEGRNYLLSLLRRRFAPPVASLAMAT